MLFMPMIAAAARAALTAAASSCGCRPCFDRLRELRLRAAIAVASAMAAICFSLRPGAPPAVSTLPRLSFRSLA